MNKVPKKIQKLRNARLNAVQALYMYEQSDFSIYEILNGFVNGELGQNVITENIELGTETFIPILKADEELLTIILQKFADNQEYIDTIINNSFDERWEKDRLEIVLKSIIRCGVVEIVYRENTDIATIINEYIGITESFYNESEIKLVHAILHKIGNTIR